MGKFNNYNKQTREKIKLKNSVDSISKILVVVAAHFLDNIIFCHLSSSLIFVNYILKYKISLKKKIN